MVILFLVTALIPPLISEVHAKAETQNANKRASSRDDELQKRIAAVQAARASGDAEAVAHASRGLIAVALRQMADLRLIETAPTAAVDLYKQSLEFEENPSSRIDLAVAYLHLRKPDDALTEAQRAIFAAPDDARSWRVQGMAYMLKHDYSKAASSLERSVVLQDDLEVAYSLGISLLEFRQKDKAVAVFKKMDEEAANRGALHVLMARAYRDAGYLEEAADELKVALAINPNTLHAHYLMGLVTLLRSEWTPSPEIRQQFLMELKLNPRDFLSNYLLGATASIIRNFAESDHYLHIAADIDPSWPEPWIYLGLNANSQGDYLHAEECLRKAITVTGSDYSRSNYLIGKAYFALGRILRDSGRREEAEKYFSLAAELRRREREQNRQEMSAYQGKGMGTPSMAIPDEPGKEAQLSAALETTDPTSQLDASVLERAPLTAEQKEQVLNQEKRLRAILGASFNDLATSEAFRQKYDLGLAHYREAERWDSKLPGLARNLGITAAHAQDYTQAVRSLSSELRANPQDKTVRAILGLSYYMTDQYKDAAQTISLLGDAVWKDPALAYAWADSLVKDNNFKQAAEVLAKLEGTQLTNEMRIQVGHAWEAIGNYNRAVEMYHRLSETAPTLPKAHYYAGLAYIHADQPAEAAAEFKMELIISPDDPDAQYNLGFVNLQLGQRQEAVSLFQSVTSSHPEHADAQYQLGKLQMDEGKVKDAIVHLEAAVRLSPQSDYMHYQLQAAYRADSRISDADRELTIYKDVKARKRAQAASKLQRGSDQN